MVLVVPINACLLPVIEGTCIPKITLQPQRKIVIYLQIATLQKNLHRFLS